ncbi:uncharacterized protein BKA55DRAFT_542043 [Fusarium redolens]|uniref:F-box domain-containing protein n=1 Tax=Fusarium redolens TaxID=48865 RepID=A0A9P9JWZ5_FUSRE|nr:uncharacterized protein BKA55DRAFT_542043 [Fusarium redolens]KAH7240732.1 hypothetical protein BKA55DRAFT_542043 [Fusarium redolens]
MEDLPSADIRLPAEILLLICSHISRQDQLRSRLVSRKLNYAATIHAFESLRLMPEGESSKHFKEIALSDTLRTFVKEVTIVSEENPDVQHGDESFWLFDEFLDTLGHVRFFQNLTCLHFRYSQFSMPLGRLVTKGDLWCQYIIIDTIPQAVTGLWEEENENNVFGCDPVQEGNDELQYAHNDPVLPSGQPLKIKELTISNLVTFNYPRLIESKAWNKLLQLPTLIDLKFLIGKKYGLGRHDSLHCAQRRILPIFTLTMALTQCGRETTDIITIPH